MQQISKIIIIGLFTSFNIALVSSGSNTNTIVFDNSIGFFGLNNEEPTGFSELRNELELEGFSVSDSLELKANYEEITP